MLRAPLRAVRCQTAIAKCTMRSFSQPPGTSTWKAVVDDKTAAMNERITGAIAVMNLNNGVVEKAALVTKEAVGSIKTDVEKAALVTKEAVSSIKTDVDKAVDGIKTDLDKTFKQEMSSLKSELKSMESVVSAKVDSMKDTLKLLEKLVFAAMAVFIFGKQIGSGISDAIEVAKKGGGNTVV